MSQEIAVVGSSDFTTGFRLAGVRKFRTVADDEKEESLDEAVETVLEDDDVGIVVMHDEDLSHLSRGTRESVERRTGAGHPAAPGAREQIKRAIGIDLMAED